MTDNTFNMALSPIRRSSPSKRLLVFQKNEYQIYNKFNPHYQAGGDFGNDSPYVYTKLTDSTKDKELTRYDTQGVPQGSTIRDITRIAKFTASGRGILFTGQQILLQGSAPFDETRTYNFGGVLSATGRNLPLAVTERPYRHIESNGGLLNFFVTSLFSSFGAKAKDMSNAGSIPGTATGTLPTIVQTHGDGRYGVMRAETATTGRGNFDRVWAGAGKKAGNSGIIQSVLKSIASTTGLFSGRGRKADWEFRPEYKNSGNENNTYSEMIADTKNLLSYTGINRLYQNKGISTGKFYNDSKDPLNYADLSARNKRRDKAINDYNDAAFIAYELGEDPPEANIPDGGADLNTIIKASDLVINKPATSTNTDNRYASPRVMSERAKKDIKDDQGIVALYNRMQDAMIFGGIDSFQHPMYNKSIERYTTSELAGFKIDDKNNYKKIPNSKDNPGGYLNFIASKENTPEGITIDDRMFSKAATQGNKFGTPDKYNLLTPDDVGSVGDLSMGAGATDSSLDLIYLYFHDLVNNKYIPFRATLTSLQDQHSPDIEEIKYMGRADRTFIYKGFSRDVSFGFKVYANSIDELIPMWKRINYMTGLTRPSRYTGRAEITRTPAANSLLANAGLPQNQILATTTQTTGNESGFIYPPMIEFRIGDLYVDQPAILGSVNMTIPDDATWETLRSDNYKYIYGDDKVIEKNGVKSRQLPNMADITVQLRMLERTKSITGGQHFGPINGWESAL